MALFLCLAMFGAAHAQNKYALLIGVDYEGSVALDYTRQDAIEMGRILKNNFGFKTKVLTKKSDTTRKAIKRAFSDLKENGKNYDSIIVFFSGHVQRDKGSKEVGYLLPNDVDKNDLFMTAIDMSIIQNLSKTLKSKQVLFIMDCSYSGIIGSYFNMDIAGGDETLRSRQVLTAGRSEQKARMYEAKGLSLYTHYLTRALSREGKFIRADSGKDGKFTARDLQTYVEKKVSNHTNKKQTPRLYNYTEDDGIFLFRDPNHKKTDGVILDSHEKTKNFSVYTEQDSGSTQSPPAANPELITNSTESRSSLKQAAEKRTMNDPVTTDDSTAMMELKVDLFTETNKIIEKMKMANIAFNTPESMNIEKTAVIHLILGIQKSMATLKDMIMSKGEKAGARIRVYSRMKASLTGQNFKIMAIIPEEQAISGYETTEWKWDIKPQKVGDQSLHLTLSAQINVEGESTSRTIRTFDRVIKIKVTAAQQIKTFFKNNWQWLWMVMFAPLGTLLWKKRRAGE